MEWISKGRARRDKTVGKISLRRGHMKTFHRITYGLNDPHETRPPLRMIADRHCDVAIVFVDDNTAIGLEHPPGTRFTIKHRVRVVLFQSRDLSMIIPKLIGSRFRVYGSKVTTV